jgi:CheY-like chemotaxis protein
VNHELGLVILHKSGLRANAAENDEGAIGAFQREHYDLVLMDAQMPELGGLDATRLIRGPQSAVRNHQIPIVVVTVAAMRGNRACYLKAAQYAGISGVVDLRLDRPGRVLIADSKR